MKVAAEVVTMKHVMLGLVTLALGIFLLDSAVATQHTKSTLMPTWESNNISPSVGTGCSLVPVFCK